MGRKWALTVVRDVAFFPDASFTLILRNNPGLRQRTLSLRLRQLASDGVIERSPHSGERRRQGYRLTAKGQQLWPVLAGLMQYGMRNHAATVFSDARPRNLEEVFPRDVGILLGRFAGFPDRGTRTTSEDTADTDRRGELATR
jgi:DNA-binding HxlR family transcriptional regulator